MTLRLPSLLQQIWLKWRSLRLPWRRRFLVGYDLSGSSYWEFRVAGAPRWRRIVHYPRSTHYSEIRVPPAWHQWLRYTRIDAPSAQEQVADQARQERLRVLAAQADARWAAKPMIGETSAGATRTQALTEGACAAAGSREVETERGHREQPEQRPQKAGRNPWQDSERASQTADSWQPDSWNPNTSREADQNR